MINFATVGTNFVVDWFIKATSKCDSLKYRGTYSRNIEKAKEFGEKYGSTLFFDDLDKLAKCDSIDAVYIASPTSFHFEQALKMIENKKHVFVEKPMASNSREVEILIEKANENNVVLIEGMRPVYDDTIPVKEGDTVSLGSHELTFVMAPMVHWPEVMVTYEKTEKILFSADAFGSFGAVDGNIFADEIDDKGAWLSEARRYYTNIVGKFGMSVQGLLKKAAGLEIRMICPLHSVIWREDLPWLIDKYLKWSSYTPEEKSVTIAYGSVYGHTEKAADILAGKLADRGIRHISVFDVSKTHPSYIIADAFRTSAMVFASITYNGGIFCNMDTLLHQLAAHGLTNRTAALIQNGTWAATTSKQMGEILGTMKNIHVLESDVTIKSALKDNQEAELDALADAIAASLQ